jgi:hypothetical protein
LADEQPNQEWKPRYNPWLIEEVERAARRILNEHGAELADAFWDYIES